MADFEQFLQHWRLHIWTKAAKISATQINDAQINDALIKAVRVVYPQTYDKIHFMKSAETILWSRYKKICYM